MPRSVDEGFATLLGWLTPTDTETSAAASHRASIDACLKSTFTMTSFFRSGSFGFGTSVSGFSDVDYFAVVPSIRLKSDSGATLTEFATALRTRFPNTGVKIDTPAIAVPFGSTLAERHEIIPAHRTGNTTSGHNLYGIPNRAGGWMYASPDAHAAWIDATNTKFGGKLKPLIRLLKAWKYYCNPAEVLRVLDALQTDELCPCNWQKGEEVIKTAA
jgi:hypothetical protein